MNFRLGFVRYKNAHIELIVDVNVVDTGIL